MQDTNKKYIFFVSFDNQVVTVLAETAKKAYEIASGALQKGDLTRKVVGPVDPKAYLHKERIWQDYAADQFKKLSQEGLSRTDAIILIGAALWYLLLAIAIHNLVH